ncbi:hypothetical protein C3489_09930 [Streptomyces sp. Ru71]|nr:hypothetical protein C3489_09930 [Streptomyces sp. Ru71]
MLGAGRTVGVAPAPARRGWLGMASSRGGRGAFGGGVSALLVRSKALLPSHPTFRVRTARCL